MKIKDVYVYWGNMEINQISFAVDDTRLPAGFDYSGSGGNCYTAWKYFTTEQQIMEVLKYAHSAMSLYKVPIEKINMELKKIDEMRKYLHLG